jgi:hypothetical protein
MTKTLNSIGCVFSHSWTHVVIGMWHKYPHPHCSHVKTIDTVDRSVDPKTGIIRTERIVGCKQKAPMWIVKVSFMRPPPKLFAHSFPLALWRFRRRLRERNFVHRSSYPNSLRHLRQPVAITIRDMSGADTVHPVSRRANDICSICRDSDADEYVADGGGQAGKLPRRAFQAERSLG